MGVFVTSRMLDGEAFHTTEIPVRLAQLSSQLVSRSQGKRVVELAAQFRTVVLDFEGVALVGQAFADEFSRVFATALTQVQLRQVNTSPELERALRHFWGALRMLLTPCGTAAPRAEPMHGVTRSRPSC